ncbi:DUF4362 domain-containing protein [Vallitalea okinawensis]|uniref:DUF4362 domain-containing protein n=1 Tax=Vallitalea okinawensis TaxID=2078660 RepID=UPI0013009B3F|nr:DUF4362 domain-containing protein [Vallitalea okinawensis]
MYQLLYAMLCLPMINRNPTRTRNRVKNAMEELQSIPKDYPIETALANGNVVITDRGEVHNKERFESFLSNVNKGKPDHIQFVKYTINGIPLIGILEYDGMKIKFTYDTTRSKNIGYGSIDTHEGTEIILGTKERPSGHLIGTYYLIMPKGKQIIFSFSYRF